MTAARTRITATSVADMRADPDKTARGADTLWWDDKLTGFGVKITPAGSKSYVFQYRRLADGKSRRLTIGSADKVSARTAREEAEKAARAVRDGTDPMGEKAARREAPTVAAAVEQWLADIARRARHGDLAEGTAQTYTYRANRYIIPAFGSRKVTDLTADAIEAWRDREYDAGRMEGTKTTLRVLGVFGNWLVDEKLATSNPAAGLGQYSGRRRERFLRLSEIEALGAVLAVWEQRSPLAAAAIRLLLFTGMRRGEVLSLRWDAIDLERGVIVLEKHKTSRVSGAKRIPLTPHVVEVLDRAKGWRLPGNPFVFPAQPDRLVARPRAVDVVKLSTEHYTPEGLTAAWKQMRTAAGVPDVRIHDLRHSFASLAVDGGAPLLTIGKALGHSSVAITERYAHLATDVVARTAGQVAAAVAARLDAGADKLGSAPADGEGAANVVRLDAGAPAGPASSTRRRR